MTNEPKDLKQANAEQEKRLRESLRQRLALRRLERPSLVAKNLELGPAPTKRVLRGYGHVVRTCAKHEAPYVVGPGTELRVLEMDDDLAPKCLPPLAELESLADHINRRREHASVYVHCRMGMNRSGLVTALALVRAGSPPKAVIEHLRKARSELVLANPMFERFVLAYPNVTPFYDGTEQAIYEANVKRRGYLAMWDDEAEGLAA